MNSIHASEEVPYPGSREIERRIKSLIRWNAMAMVVRANRLEDGIGGHISTFASSATLYEVGFNHFFHGRDDGTQGDMIFFQGHSSPGIYARAFLEGRITLERLENFRRELRPNGGLSSYPHPWLMPHFWEFPTVSMGLGPMMAIYQARFNRYLEDRGLKPASDAKVWAFLGDGETDEPETLGAIRLASREKLDNLIFVVNCNLQRLDGPVRGNGQIIQELEAIFRGAGWNVVKVLWGTEWDALLQQDHEGVLVKRMGEIVDGEYQKYAVEPGAYVRKHFWGADPRLLEMVKHVSDEQLKKLTLGGHDLGKVYNAYKRATECKGMPSVVLARTIKGYGLGEAGEGKNVTHQQKHLNDDELKTFRTRFGIPISDDEVSNAPFYRPPENSAEIKYLVERRRALKGFVPKRQVRVEPLRPALGQTFAEFLKGTEERKASTTMVFVRMLSKLLRDERIGKLIVPIVPDEARTFGMEALFRQVAHLCPWRAIVRTCRQRHAPLLQGSEGRSDSPGRDQRGWLDVVIHCGGHRVCHARHQHDSLLYLLFHVRIPADRRPHLGRSDQRMRGFLLGATSGRTTLNGEGLQHADGNSHTYAMPYPTCQAYDPAFAYELAVIIEEGLKRMYDDQEDIFYYLTLMNEQYEHPAMPEGVREGILKGMYVAKPTSRPDAPMRAQLFGSGTILIEVLKAQKLLEERYSVGADVWSVTSYLNLYRDGHACERWNRLHPSDKPRVPYVTKATTDAPGVFVAASDYLKMLPDVIDRWLPRRMHSLGTDGFGRSDSRAALRDFFEVDARFITLATLYALQQEDAIAPDVVEQAIRQFEIDVEKPDPVG